MTDTWTHAQRVAAAYNATVPTIENANGDWKDGPALRRWIAAIEKDAASVSTDCPESHDSSLLFTFTDGSQIYLANPRQDTYCAWIAVYNNKKKTNK